MAEKEIEKNKKEEEKDQFDFLKISGDGEDDKQGGFSSSTFPVWLIVFAALMVLGFMNMFSSTTETKTIEFSEFRRFIESGIIKEVELSDTYVYGYVKEKVNTPNSKKQNFYPFPVAQPKSPDFKAVGLISENFVVLLNESGVKYSVMRPQNGFLIQILGNLLFIVLLGVMWYIIYRKMGGASGGAFLGIGGSRARSVDEGKVKTRFADVAGVDEAKEELVEIVDFLKSPKKYTDIGGKIPKGVLLVGPPGTGKTMLARAVAGEAGVPFFRVSGSDFEEMFVGVGASRVRDLFKQAREKAPCIIFIDEIDALGRTRVNGVGSNSNEQTLNQLLVEMDGFDNEKGLIVLAATNRADVLDPALLRPGRFDRHVPVEKPDVKGREEILRIHAKNVKVEDDVNFENLAHGTIGFAGADLANVVNEAALLAVRNGHKKVTMSDFDEAIDKVSIGLKKKSRKDNEKEMHLVSVHETGHALVGAFTPDYPPVNKITVVPRSHGVGGFTQYREEEEKHTRTRKDMLSEVDTLLGGRAAEEIVLGDISTGASNDIARATDIIKRMIVDFGMGSKFKNMTLGKGVLGNNAGEPVLVREFSEDTQKFIDQEISRIMNERYKHVLVIIKAHKALVEHIAKRLIEVETLDGKEFYDIIKSEKTIVGSAAKKTTKPRTRK